MRSLLVYLKKYRRDAILAPAFKLLEALFELAVPLVMAGVIDVGIAQGDTGYILRMCGLLVLLGVAGLAVSITAQFFAARAATGFAAGLRRALFGRIQEFSFSQMDLFGTDTLVTRMTSDISQVQSGLNLTLRLFLRSPFIVFGSMVMAFTVDARSARVFAATIPLLAVVVFGVMLISLPLYGKVQTRLDGIMTATRENLSGARVIRAFGQEDREEERFRAQNAELTRTQKFVGRISALMNPLTYVMVNIATAVLIQRGAVRVDSGILTQGQVIALLNYMSQILVELIKMANFIIQMTKASACARRVADVLETEPDMPDGSLSLADADPNAPAVAFHGVSLSYKGSSGRALEDVSFTARRGETVGIIGGTGSGKSSLVNLIPRFYDATSGSVEVLGHDVRAYREEELRRAVGVVLQKAELFKGTIAGNVRWGNESATDEEVDSALAAAQAKEFVDSRAEGSTAPVEQSGRNLSGGQKQRLTIARALLKKPEILILDDSASALDFATDARLRAAIREASRDMTTFIVSQRAASVQHADQILVLDDGRLVARGTHEELLASSPVYQEIYYSQFPKEDAAHG